MLNVLMFKHFWLDYDDVLLQITSKIKECILYETIFYI